MSEGRFAVKTKTPPDKTRTEVEKTVVRYGATAFAYGSEGDMVMIGFKLKGRTVRMMIPMPDAHGYSQTAHEQRVRSRWRATLLVIKAKLEAIASGIRTVEAEFLNDIVLPTGLTVGETLAPQIEAAYATGKMPPLLPGPSA